jgi:hypothetical protein
MNPFSTFQIDSKPNSINLKKNSWKIGKKFFTDQVFDETFSKIILETKNEDSYADVMKKITSLEELSNQLRLNDESEEESKIDHKEKIHKKKFLKQHTLSNFSQRNSNQIRIYKLPKLKIHNDTKNDNDVGKHFPRIKLSVIPEIPEEKKRHFNPEQSSTRKSLKFISNFNFYKIYRKRIE